MEKIITMRTLICASLLLLLNCQTINAQSFKYGLKVMTGYSWLTSNIEVPNATLKISSQLSSNIGFFVRHEVTSDKSFGADIMLVQLNSKDVFDIPEFMDLNQNVIGSATDEYRSKLNYIGLPVYFKYYKKKFGVKLGMRSLIYIGGRVIQSAEARLDNRILTIDKEEPYSDADVFNFGPEVGMSYDVNENIELDLDFYVGINDMTSTEFGFERRHRQATLGISYSL